MVHSEKFSPKGFSTSSVIGEDNGTKSKSSEGKKVKHKNIHPSKSLGQNAPNRKAYVKKKKNKNPWGRWYPGTLLEDSLALRTLAH